MPAGNNAKENVHPQARSRPLVPKTSNSTTAVAAAPTSSVAATKPNPMTHPERCTFYFDLSDTAAVLKLTRYTVMLGAQCSAFFDKNVTHLVTDKARGISDNYSRACKWGFEIWHLEKFADMVISYLERTQKKQQVELSPTLQKAASATRKRDLQHYLEEEKRKTRKPSYNTNLTAREDSSSVATTGALMEMKELEHPFVLIEDAEHRYASVFKEYESKQQQQIKYPVFYWNSAPGHSPFVLPHNPVFTINRPLPPSDYCTPSTTSKLAAGGMTTRSKAGRKPATPVFRRPTYTATTNKPKAGFCECCWDKFSDMDHHTQTNKHRNYARNSEHYFLLDNLLDERRRSLPTQKCHLLPALPISPAKSHATKTGKEEDKCSVDRGYTATKRRRQVEAARAMFDKAPSLADILSSPSVKRQRRAQTGNAAPIKRRLFV